MWILLKECLEFLRRVKKNSKNRHYSNQSNFVITCDLLEIAMASNHD